MIEPPLPQERSAFVRGISRFFGEPGNAVAGRLISDLDRIYGLYEIEWLPNDTACPERRTGQKGSIYVFGDDESRGCNVLLSGHGQRVSPVAICEDDVAKKYGGASYGQQEIGIFQVRRPDELDAGVSTNRHK